MKNYNILDNLSKEKIIETVERLGQAKLTSTSHLYSAYANSKIIHAARDNTRGYSDRAKTRPAIGLIEVVLAANRSYNKHVKPNIDRIETESDLKSFDQLIKLITTPTRDDFYKFWGPKSEKKFLVLKNILDRIPSLRKMYPHSKSDFELMMNWAKAVDLRNYENDLIGEIKNVAIATIQHLRMTFGHDTVKPDQRVKEVLMIEFGQPRLNNVDTVLTVEQIAKLTSYTSLEIDQVFVNYGSGYYNRVEGGFNGKNARR